MLKLRKRQTEPMCKTPVTAYYCEKTNRYAISIGITRYPDLDLHDLNAVLRANKVSRDQIDWHSSTFNRAHMSYWLAKR